ncbi:protein containg 4Fe-4S binding domain [Longilinea arvoryzae]|uniref:Protein containg 4Fe-4S binding domain n=1 Tax=Longilinea arvoryzae TaxID=360412 RepID=A0A0S7BES9_9CHLR|nr:4Fe-4S dicluster domain-containing protein [Longilinea arvoryzae]GAP12514.1 protein containg 4Fe-4S binding domain [Longilinea arvoryzae]
MNEQTYRRLARHLDQLPDGFPPSRTGADLHLLELLFSPQEAELAVHLTLERESAGLIAARAGLAPDAGALLLDEMAQKGLILSMDTEDGGRTYMAAPFVVGIYEFQVNNLSVNFLHALWEYWSTTVDRPSAETIPQMRTIPIHESIDPRLETVTYEQVNAIVDAHTRFAVAPCICRRGARMVGKGCDAPEESCLIFGEWAEFYARTGRGRKIDRSEMLALIARADAANLVLRPSNSQDVSFICCCCGCCCGGLVGLKRHPRPADVVASAFIASLAPEDCQGCFTCLQRCQMQALVEDGDRVALKQERCIGCGLCVTTCPSGALTLVRKSESGLTRVPPTMEDTWRIISQTQNI